MKIKKKISIEASKNIKCYQNMGATLIFQFFSTAILIAQIISPTALRGETSTNQMTDENPPLLTCTLFNDNSACNAMCFILASTIYAGTEASGTCSDKNCKCDIPPNVTLENSPKIDSRDILHEIRKNDDLSKKILHALKTPQQTSKQSKQLEDLRVKQDYTIQKYIVEKLQSLQTPLESKVICKSQLIKTLRDANENTFNYILQAIRRSKNKRLNEFLDCYVEDRKIRERPIQSQDRESVIDILDIAIINEILKPTSRKTKPYYAHSKSTNSKSNIAQENLPEKQINTSGSSEKILSAVNKRTKNTVDAHLDKTLYTLEGFDQTQVARFKEGIKGNSTWDKCWKELDVYEVCTTRYTRAEFFTWHNIKQLVNIEMRKTSNGNVVQTWKMGCCGFELQRNADGKITQYWDLPNGSHWEYIKSPDGEVTQHWEGEEDWKSVEYYKSFMDSWCGENGSYYNVGGEPCIMY